MSSVKERILGAVTVMSEKDAKMVWNLIQSAFALSNAESVIPDEDERSILTAYNSGDPEYQATVSQEDLIKELHL